MILRRPLLAALVLLFVPLLAACGGEKKPEGWASPAVDGRTAYFFPAKDRFSAVTIGADNTITKLWQFPDKAKPNQKDLSFKASYGMVVDGDAAYFASWDGHVYAVALADGAFRWGGKNLIAGGVVGQPAIAGDRVIIASTDGRLYAFRKENGNADPAWPTGGVRFSDAIWAAPVVSGDRIFIATMGGQVYALNAADGQPAWAAPFKIPGAIPDLALLDKDHLFVPALDRHVYIVNTADGTQLGEAFATDEWVWTEPAFRDNVAYFGDLGGKVYALDITLPGPSLKWSVDVADKVKARPVLIDNILVVANRAPAVYFIDILKGEIVNKVPMTGAGTVRAGLVLDGLKALIATTNGKLFEADPKSRSVTPLTVPAQGANP